MAMFGRYQKDRVGSTDQLSEARTSCQEVVFQTGDAKSKVLTRKSLVNSLLVLKDNCLSDFSFSVHYTRLKGCFCCSKKKRAKERFEQKKR